MEWCGPARVPLERETRTSFVLSGVTELGWVVIDYLALSQKGKVRNVCMYALRCAGGTGEIYILHCVSEGGFLYCFPVVFLSLSLSLSL